MAGVVRRAFAVSLQELPAHVQRADQNADGASAQEGEMARSRARDDRGQEPGEDRGALRRPSDNRLPLAASVSSRAGRQQASNLSESSKRTKPSSSNPSKATVRSAAQARKRGGTARHPGSYQDNIPILVARDRTGAPRRHLPQVDSALIDLAYRRSSPRHHPHRRWRQGDRRFARKTRIPLPRRAVAGQTDPRSATSAHQQRQRLLTAASSNGSTASTASPPKPAKYLGWRRALEAWDQPPPPKWINAHRKWTISTTNAIRADNSCRKTETALSLPNEQSCPPPIAGARFWRFNRAKGPQKNFSAKIACNPLISLVSDERIQGNPRKSNTQNVGFS